MTGRKHILTLTKAFIVFAVTIPALTKGPLDCKIYVNDERLFFDLGTLQSENDYSLPLSFTLPNGTASNGDFDFNFCTQASRPINECPYTGAAFGFVYVPEVCYPMSGAATEWQPSRYEYGEDSGLVVWGRTADGGTFPYDMKYTVICSDESEAMNVTYVTNEQGKDYINLVIRDPAGCPTDLNALISFIEEHPWIFGAVFLVFGSFFIFMGYRFFKICVSAVGFLVGFLGVLLVTLWFWNYKTGSQAQIFFVIFGSFCVGVLIAYVFFVYKSIGVVGAGVFLGFLVGNIATNITEAIAASDLEEIYYWLIVGGSMVLFALFGYFLQEHCLIIATALSGSYLFVKGLGAIFGNFPDEVSIGRKLKEDDFDFPWQWWVYIGLMGSLLIGGLVVQYMHRAKKKAEKEEDDGWKVGLMDDDNKYR